MIDQLFPIINADDVRRSMGFWVDLLGGAVAFEWPGPEGEPGYVGIDLGASHLGIGRASPGLAAGPRPIALWVYTDDCDALVERLRGAGTTITEEPADRRGVNGSRASSIPTGTRSSSGSAGRRSASSGPDGTP